MPTTAAELERLPGIGPYTAAAVASIAFGEAVPVLDGNVARVVARRLALAQDPARRETRVACSRRRGAGRPAPRGRLQPGLMELGARVCTPRAPRCAACPLAAGCRGAESGAAEAYPPRARGARRAACARSRRWSRAPGAGLVGPPRGERSGDAGALGTAHGGGCGRRAARRPSRRASERLASVCAGCTAAPRITFRRSSSRRGGALAGGGGGGGDAAGWFTRAELAPCADRRCAQAAGAAEAS